MKMWKCLLLVIVYQTGTTLSQHDFFTTSVNNIGKSINVIDHYGYFDLFMRVIPNTIEDWSSPIDLRFIKSSSILKENFDLISIMYLPEVVGNVNDTKVGKVSVDLCDTIEDVYRAYFKNMEIDDFPRPWTLFTSVWSLKEKKNKFGIPMKSIKGDYSFVLLKTSLINGETILRTPIANLRLKDHIEEDLRKISDCSESIINFSKRYGSHLITSYVTGSSLYQVLVYHRSKFSRIKRALKDIDINSLSSSELESYLSVAPSYKGKIRSADGSPTIEKWITDVCDNGYNVNLLRLADNSTALQQYQKVMNNAVLLKLNMKPIISIFRNETVKRCFDEKLSNTYLLWAEHSK